jgi:hypothetical protein
VGRNRCVRVVGRREARSCAKVEDPRGPRSCAREGGRTVVRSHRAKEVVQMGVRTRRAKEVARTAVRNEPVKEEGLEGRHSYARVAAQAAVRTHREMGEGQMVPRIATA